MNSFSKAKLTFTIFRQAWLMEQQSAEALLLAYFSNNYTADTADTDKKLEIKSAYEGIRFAPSSYYEARNFQGYDGADAAVIELSGPIMKDDFCGGFGSASLMNEFIKIEQQQNIKTIYLLVNSPGGMVDGTQQFANAIKTSKKNTVAIVDGMSASAAYWITSACKEVIATSDTSMIGCIGTMIRLSDNTKFLEEKGIQVREYYATESTEKNNAVNLAIKGDGKKLISEMLDPLNALFLNAVKENRNANAEVLTGKIYFAQEAVTLGLIDRIASVHSIFSQYTKTQKQKMESLTPFALVIAAAMTESFQVVDGGFLLTEENLKNLEASIKTSAEKTVEANSALETNIATIAQLQTQVAANKVTIDANATTIASLKQNPPAALTNALGDPDAKPDYTTSFDREMAEYIK